MSLEQAKIDEWKKKYGKIYKVVIAGKDYVYRALTRKEFREIQVAAASDSAVYDPSQGSVVEEEMVKRCVLYPEGGLNMDDIEAGTPTNLSQFISEASGFAVDAVPEEL